MEDDNTLDHFPQLSHLLEMFRSTYLEILSLFHVFAFKDLVILIYPLVKFNHQTLIRRYSINVLELLRNGRYAGNGWSTCETANPDEDRLHCMYKYMYPNFF
ncbi:unnamed protein product [Ilex paraguariensis]|uniref:Maturase K n=1 Tax=Ilex paraguariensis TaxID=185542 RepID=A0ABC8R202_9AQUA